MGLTSPVTLGNVTILVPLGSGNSGGMIPAPPPPGSGAVSCPAPKMFERAGTITTDGSIVGSALGLVADPDAAGVDSPGADSSGDEHPLATRQAASTPNTAGTPRRRRGSLRKLGRLPA